MTLKVLKYNADVAYHECEIVAAPMYDLRLGETIRIDLFVAGAFRGSEFTNENIVGKTVTVNWMSPYLWIANEVEKA